jgi:hypothetical protein
MVMLGSGPQYVLITSRKLNIFSGWFMLRVMDVYIL